MRRPLAIVAVLASLAAGAASRAQAQGVSAAGGDIGAELNFQEGRNSFGNPTYSDLTLRISRAGTPIYDRPISSRYCSADCAVEQLGTSPLRSSPLLVRDIDRDGEPEIVVGLNTGGAHCCTIVQVFSYDPATMTYRAAEHDFGDPGALLSDVAGNGQVEFESADDRFAYAFTSFAYSGLPLQIWRFRQGRFLDATRAFPKPLAADAARQFKQFTANQRQGLGLGFIAAWAADEHLLGNRALVARILAREARRHRLRSSDDLSPSGSGFLGKLARFLRKTGYA